MMNTKSSLFAMCSARGIGTIRRRCAPFSSVGRRRFRRPTGRRVTRQRPARKVEDEVPSLATVKSMPVSLRGMDNVALTTIAAMGNHNALQEMLKRHIMAVDNVSYLEATNIYTDIEKKNHEYEAFMALPFQASILTCATCGLLSIPLVFYLPTVEFFNEHFVTAEHPPTKELETALEVGSWSWNWMEPVLGTSTFLLLSLQYMRMHLQHLGVNPYTVRMKRMRGRHLADAFPQYSEELLIAYSESSPFYNTKDLWF